MPVAVPLARRGHRDLGIQLIQKGIINRGGRSVMTELEHIDIAHVVDDPGNLRTLSVAGQKGRKRRRRLSVVHCEAKGVLVLGPLHRGQRPHRRAGESADGKRVAFPDGFDGKVTGGYDLFMTLMITSVVAYLTIIVFEPHSLYAMRLAKKGELLTHHKDRAVLTLMKMDNVIETDLQTVTPKMTLGEMVKVIAKSNRNIFPVVSPDTGRLLGILSLDEVRNIMFRPELYNRFTVQELMVSPPAKILSDMPMEKVMDIFENTGAWNLPVVDNARDERYMGFVSKSKIFNTYRHLLVHFSEE